VNLTVENKKSEEQWNILHVKLSRESGGMPFYENNEVPFIDNSL